jgi:predicted nucleotidyltransferase
MGEPLSGRRRIFHVPALVRRGANLTNTLTLRRITIMLYFRYGSESKEAAMAIDESLVKEIVRRILTVAAADRIILFGSAAAGTMTRDSDIDLLVVEADPGHQRQRSLSIREKLIGLGYPFDVIVISTKWFEESKGVIGGIAYPANKYGKVIYEAA